MAAKRSWSDFDLLPDGCSSKKCRIANPSEGRACYSKEDDYGEFLPLYHSNNDL